MGGVRLPAISARKRLPAAIALALVLVAVLPFAAFAQSAGDDQYTDPLGGGEPQQEAPATPQGGDTPTSSDDSAPSPTGDGSSTAPPPGAEPTGTLPRTGVDSAPIAALGVLLLTLGLAIRRLPAAAPRRS